MNDTFILWIRTQCVFQLRMHIIFWVRYDTYHWYFFRYSIVIVNIIDSEVLTKYSLKQTTGCQTSHASKSRTSREMCETGWSHSKRQSARFLSWIWCVFGARPLNWGRFRSNLGLRTVKQCATGPWLEWFQLLVCAKTRYIRYTVNRYESLVFLVSNCTFIQK